MLVRLFTIGILLLTTCAGKCCTSFSAPVAHSAFQAVHVATFCSRIAHSEQVIPRNSLANSAF